MGKVDISALKDKLKNLENQGNNSGNKLWRPSKNPGETQMRIVPYKFRPENPFIELYIHYNLGKGIHLSPITFGRPDPVVEYADKLKNTGEQENYNFARKLYPSLRTFVPVVIRGEESQGVKYWGFGKTVYTNLLKHFADEDYGDLSDFKSGRDIVVEYTPPSSDDNYGKTSVRVKPKQTPLAGSKEEIMEIMDTQVEITEIYEEPDYDELREMLEEYVKGESSSDTEGSGSSTKSNDSDDGDDFDDWLNEDSDDSNESGDGKKVADRFDEMFDDL